ncbi:hypothetical protein GCM10023185_14190 [Hymenobacter saemangeumensis]|uniref:DUF433 domain-containing protein n=1 Tax=Hymenobacter saemangeumensis TaxID=1084522 RepID=A0ABP8I8C0_9BACT
MIPNWQTYIAFTPGVLGGKAAIKGTRIGVDIVLEKMAAGETVEQVLESYPHLSREAVLACLAFAANSVRNELIYAVG